MELSSSNIKKILYFRKWNPALSSPNHKKSTKKNAPRKKIPYIFGNGTFLL